MGAMLGKLGKWRTSPRLAAAVEFACLAPAVVLTIVGSIAWGGYFWLTHEIQAVANDALAAAVAELNVDDRESRAKAEAERALAARSNVLPGAMRLSVVSQPTKLTVLLVYDASRAPMFALRRLMPMPSPLIVRSASERLSAS